MPRLLRYVITVLVIIVSPIVKHFNPGTNSFSQIALHYILISIHGQYREATSLSRIAPYFQDESFDEESRTDDIPILNPTPDEAVDPSSPTSPASDNSLANATFVMLVRNSDLDGTISSIRALEDRFNSKFGYPYVLLNDEPFSEEFKRYLRLWIS